VTLPALGQNAVRLTLEETELLTPDEKGQYTLALPPASPDDFPELQAGAQAAIGGSPVMLIERPEGEVTIPPLRREFRPQSLPDA
jgi:hypothetical protein